MTIYLVFSAFTPRPFFLLANSKTSLFLFIVCMLPPNVNMSVNQMLIYTSQLQDVLVCLNTRNGFLKPKLESSGAIFLFQNQTDVPYIDSTIGVIETKF